MDESKIYALEHISSILSDHRGLMTQFNKKHYTDAFEAYSADCEPVIEAAERACLADAENQTAVLTEIVDRLLADTEKEVSSLGRFKQKNHLDTSKLILALYTVPMIQYLNRTVSEELADLLVAGWREKYPQYSFLKGTYEELLEGFKNRTPFMGWFKSS